MGEKNYGKIVSGMVLNLKIATDRKGVGQ